MAGISWPRPQTIVGAFLHVTALLGHDYMPSGGGLAAPFHHGPASYEWAGDAPYIAGRDHTSTQHIKLMASWVPSILLY